ncbi:MAG: cold-shock protein [Acidobacteria bacterium]|nr:MAG: cold-shock protein [Acidobacteriota bacterium]
MQGTVKSYDPSSKQGVLLSDTGEDIQLAPDALAGSIFRTLREGQRVVFDKIDIDGVAAATALRLGQDGR